MIVLSGALRSLLPSVERDLLAQLFLTVNEKLSLTIL